MNSESHWASKRPIPFTNVSGETIPAFAAMAITGLVYENGIAFLECDKPSTTFVREYAVNNMFDVPADLRGTCFRAGDLRVLYDSGTPAAGEGWGPKPGEWTLSKNYPAICTIDGIIDDENKILLGSLHEINSLLCQSQDDNAAGALATDTSDYKIMKGTAGSEADAGFTTQPAIYAREAISDEAFFPAAFANGLWYAVQQTGAVTMYKATLSGRLESIDGSASINTVTAFGSGTAPSPTSAVNTLDLAGDDDDNCVIIKDGTGYYLLNVEHHACD